MAMTGGGEAAAAGRSSLDKGTEAGIIRVPSNTRKVRVCGGFE